MTKKRLRIERTHQSNVVNIEMGKRFQMQRKVHENIIKVIIMANLLKNILVQTWAHWLRKRCQTPRLTTFCQICQSLVVPDLVFKDAMVKDNDENMRSKQNLRYQVKLWLTNYGQKCLR